MIEEKKSDREFVVLNFKDITRYLDENDQRTLKSICSKVCKGRTGEGKKLNNYIVCNDDEPFANDVLKVILDGEAQKHKTNFIGNSS